MKRLRIPLLHASLVVVCVLTLYPVLWVVGLALDPAQGSAQSRRLWPLPAELPRGEFTITKRTVPA